jgi:hypothetical protein
MKGNKFNTTVFGLDAIDLIDYINCIYSGNLVKARYIKSNRFGIYISKIYERNLLHT